MLFNTEENKLLLMMCLFARIASNMNILQAGFIETEFLRVLVEDRRGNRSLVILCLKNIEEYFFDLITHNYLMRIFSFDYE